MANGRRMFRWALGIVTLLGLNGISTVNAQSLVEAGMAPRGREAHFVPNSQDFWESSKNWTTNFGPAYRDTVLGASGFLPCTSTYALCFHSGPAPLPCETTKDGRFANCTCATYTGRNYVLITAILNAEVYHETVKVCGADGAACAQRPDKAPVCKAIREQRFIPGADVISTYSPSDGGDLIRLHNHASNKPGLTVCPKGPYAACMTAPCKATSSGYAQCSCPIFWGVFQLTQQNPSCTLQGNLVWSASYDPALDALR